MSRPRPSLKSLVVADLTRYRAPRTPLGLVRTYLGSPGFRPVLWHRVTAHLRGRSGLGRLAYLAARLAQRRIELKFSVVLPPTADIGPGLFIAHWDGCIVHAGVTIGANCNLGNQVTLGKAHRGAKAGVPTLGDRVFVGPGARVLGAITIGDDAVIGANAVVVDDVEAGAVVGGIPAKVISHAGSAGIVNDLS